MAFEKDIEDVMNRKAKKSDEKIFNKLLKKEIIISSFTMAIVEFIVYIYLIKVRQYDIVLVRSILLTLMVFMENVHIFNCRSENISAFKVPLKNNVFLICSILITSLIQIAIVTIKPLAEFFQLTTISGNYILAMIILTLIIIFIMEIFKKSRKSSVAIEM